MEADDLKAMSDEDLSAFHVMVIGDLRKAALEQPESEWHQACFAAALVVSNEAWSRQQKH